MGKADVGFRACAERLSQHFGFTPGGREGLQWALLAIAFLAVPVTRSEDNRYEWMGHFGTRRMEEEGELRRGHAEAAMRAVTCHGGTALSGRPGLASLVIPEGMSPSI